jgi:KDO transferase-3
LFASPLALWHIAQLFSPERIRCRVFLLDDMRFPAGRRAIAPAQLRSAWHPSTLALFDTREALGFSLDVRRGVMDGCTVAYSGLQVLASLGFERIYLHGVDLTDARHTPRFYEQSADMQPSTLDRDFNDFIEPSFRNASALLRRSSVEVYNLSRQSALGEDIFPKVPWRSLVTGDASPRAVEVDSAA